MPKKGDTYQFSKELKVQVVQSYLYDKGIQLATAKKYELKSRGVSAEILTVMRGLKKPLERTSSYEIR